MHTGTKMKHEDFVNGLKEKGLQVEVLGQYNGMSNPVHTRCIVCGHDWFPKARSLQGGHGCPKCSKTYRRTTDDFIKEMGEINPTLRILGEYKNNHTPILTLCTVCGNEWSPQPSNLLGGAKCLKCSYRERGINSRISETEFIERLVEKNPRLELHGEYTKISEPTEIRCKDCGYIWKVDLHSILEGHSCPNCISHGTSLMEKTILLSLRKTLGEENVLSRDKSAIGKELDIYIPSINMAIEPGSWYYHQHRIKQDNKKREACKKAGVKLITIFDSFNETGTLEESDDIWTYSINIGAEHDLITLRSLVERIYRVIGVFVYLNDFEWKSIIEKSYVNIRRKSTDELRNEVQKIRPDIEIIGDYQGSANAIRCRCKVCGYLWDSTPNRLLHGSGCRKCGRIVYASKRKLTHEQYVEKLKAVNPTIEVIDNYIDSKHEIKVKCRNCGHEWPVIPTSISSGHSGCPNCANARKGKYTRR